MLLLENGYFSLMLTVLFGSYDAEPDVPTFVSQYKNLFYHYTHQASSSSVSTFWAGCGAVKRSAFLKLEGFDVAQFPTASIEDIELGYRLSAMYGPIQVIKVLQVKHLKAWTLKGLVQSDVFDRAIPWSRLLITSPHLGEDLNVNPAQKLCVILVFLLPCLTWLHFVLGIGVLFAILVINRHWYRFAWQQRGAVFCGGAVVMHLLYFVYSGLAYAWVWLTQHNNIK